MNLQGVETYLRTLGFNLVDSPEIEHIDDRRYRFSLFLLNQDGAAVRIRRGSIQELVIEDDILDWYHKGHITFQNPEDVIERANSVIAGNSASATMRKTVPYKFRGDCRDLLYFVFEPLLGSGSDEKAVSTTLESPTYTMKFLFTVYAIEDVTSPGGTKEKLQKMYFHDYRYQLLREKNIYYSTAKSEPVLGESTNISHDNITQFNNDNREKYTGDIIQDILKKALPEIDTKDMFSYHWNFGESKMMYTTPSDSKAIDDLDHILSSHVSTHETGNQPCIFRLERYTDRWELLPLSEYFKRSTYNGGPGPLQTEHFLLSVSTEVDEKEIPAARKTFGRDIQTPAINYHFADLSVITDYVFSELSGIDCQDILNTTVVHRNDYKQKTFNIDIEDHHIKSVQNDFQTLLIDHTYGGDRGHGSTSWLTDTTRDNNYNIRVVSGPNDRKKALSCGRNKTLLGGMLLGNTIQFSIRGEPSRRAGVWIALDKDAGYKDNDYDSKVLGQYFVTRAVHRFDDNSGYTNNIMGVKPYFYKTQQFDDTDIFYQEIDAK